MANTKPPIEYCLLQPAVDTDGLIFGKALPYTLFSGDSIARKIERNSPRSLFHEADEMFAKGVFKQVSMDKLSSEDAKLIIYGHGNLGDAIGDNKKNNYSSKKLVELLEKRGLQKEQKGLKIYLIACNSGCTCQVNAKTFNRTSSYAAKFAKHLANQGFSSIQVVGMVGFITEDGIESCLEHGNDSRKHKIKGWKIEGTYCLTDELNPVSPTDPGRQVLFNVKKGKSTKISKNDWMVKKRNFRVKKENEMLGQKFHHYTAYEKGSEESEEKKDDEDEEDEEQHKLQAATNESVKQSIKVKASRGRDNSMTTKQYERMLHNRERLMEEYCDYIVNEDGYNNLGYSGYKLR
mmetsp:Transcript_4485/g.5194  ORF Transcript_4485/g.5194 Transcript_4485/m.5194 type:complete len:349 (-) Transcript_4485:255-1301(-)